MALYRGSYFTDYGLELRSITLPLYRYVNDERLETSYAFDTPYVVSLLAVSQRGRGVCSLPFRAYRSILCYINDNEYLDICCPFNGNDSKIRDYISELVNLNQFSLIVLKGEFIPSSESYLLRSL